MALFDMIRDVEHSLLLHILIGKPCKNQHGTQPWLTNLRLSVRPTLGSWSLVHLTPTSLVVSGFSRPNTVQMGPLISTKPDWLHVDLLSHMALTMVTLSVQL